MKRMTKKLGAIILALAMCMSLCCTALVSAADAGTYTITISNAHAGQTYAAYKIFDATYDNNGNYAYTTTSENAWYKLFATDDGVTGYTCPFEFTPTSTEGEEPDTITNYNVTVKAEYEGNDAYIIEYLSAAINQIGNPIEDENGKVTWYIPSEYGSGIEGVSNGDGTVTIDVSEAGAGYYFVTTTTGSVVSITTTDPQASIIDKNTPFDLKKTVNNGLEDTTDGSEDDSLHNDAEAMGDDVEFTVTANVPLYTSEEPDNLNDEDKILASPEGYLVTDYSFEDQMSAGLEIRDLEEGVDYTYKSAWVYDAETGTYTWTEGYFATDTLINKWITISDGTTTYNLTDVAYNIVLQLIESTYIDENGDEQVQFDGFTLYYETLPYTVNEDGTRTLYYTDEEGEVKPVAADTFQTAPELVAAVESKYPTNASIEIDYTAHVTSEAVYDNTNDITMHWDATPYRSPNPNEPVYKGSEKDDDDIYVLALNVLKVDGSDDLTPLKGATFQLEGTNLKEVVTSSTETYTPLTTREEYDSYVEKKAELWFELVDGGYTNIDPYTSGLDEDELAKYVYDDQVGAPENYHYVAYTRTITYEQTTQDAINKTVTGTTDENGVVSFEGLTVGTWTLTEIAAPDGYNLLTDALTFEISVTWSEDGTPEWKVTSDNDAFKLTPIIETTETEDGDGNTVTTETIVGYNVSVTVENNSGTELPSTGGIGTTIFYIIGGVLVVGAVVVLVTRRRVNHEA